MSIFDYTIPATNRYLDNAAISKQDLQAFHRCYGRTGRSNSSLFVDFAQEIKALVDVFNTRVSKKYTSDKQSGYISRYFHECISRAGKGLTIYSDFCDIVEAIESDCPVWMKSHMKKWWNSKYDPVNNPIDFDVTDNVVSCGGFPWVIQNSKRNIFLAVENVPGAFEAVLAYRQLAGKENRSVDSGWKCARIFECGDLYDTTEVLTLGKLERKIEGLKCSSESILRLVA